MAPKLFCIGGGDLRGRLPFAEMARGLEISALDWPKILSRRFFLRMAQSQSQKRINTSLMHIPFTKRVDELFPRVILIFQFRTEKQIARLYSESFRSKEECQPIIDTVGERQ